MGFYKTKDSVPTKCMAKNIYVCFKTLLQHSFFLSANFIDILFNKISGRNLPEDVTFSLIMHVHSAAEDNICQLIMKSNTSERLPKKTVAQWAFLKVSK